MDKEQVGRSPLRGSGHSAEPEPVPVSAASAASTPNAGYTPGPWRAFQSSVCAGKGPDLDLICNVRVNRPEAKANARLIAAAPELLQAAMGCWALLQADANYEGSEVKELARAAIARATGAS